MGEGKVLQSNGVDELLAYNFGTVIADSPIPVKFGFQNEKNRNVSPVISFINQSGSDMDTLMLVANDTVTISCPYNFSVSLIAQTTYLELLTTYYYVIEAYNCNGKTGESLEVSIITTDGSHTPKLVWSSVQGADGYYIYRSTSSEIYTNTLITKIIGGSINSFIDTGTLTGQGTPLSENTTGGSSPNYGTAPSSGYATTLGLGTVGVGQKKFFWVEVDAPLTISESTNPRNCLLRISE